MKKTFLLITLIIVLLFLINSITFAQSWGNDIDGEAAGDASGYSVALSSDGSRVVIGAPHIDVNVQTAGMYVYLLMNQLLL